MFHNNHSQEFQDSMSPPKRLLSEVERWLDEKGYPFEMRVAAAFRQAGFGVSQSEYYHDTVTGTPREIDVVPTIRSDLGSGVFRIQFINECKVTLEKPWLFFCTGHDQLPKPAWVAQRYATGPLGGLRCKTTSRLGPYSLFLRSQK